MLLYLSLIPTTSIYLCMCIINPVIFSIIAASFNLILGKSIDEAKWRVLKLKLKKIKAPKCLEFLTLSFITRAP